MIFFLYYLCKNTFSNGVTSILLYRPSSPIEVPFKKAKDKGLGFLELCLQACCPHRKSLWETVLDCFFVRIPIFIALMAGTEAFQLCCRNPRGTAPVPCDHLRTLLCPLFSHTKIYITPNILLCALPLALHVQQTSALKPAREPGLCPPCS